MSGFIVERLRDSFFLHRTVSAGMSVCNLLQALGGWGERGGGLPSGNSLKMHKGIRAMNKTLANTVITGRE